MQQRQLRLGDTLDDYCPRERRITNHAVVAMVGPDVKLTRCTTCDTEHDYKQARVPRQRRKAGEPARVAHGTAAAPKRVAHDPEEVAPECSPEIGEHGEAVADVDIQDAETSARVEAQADAEEPQPDGEEDGPVHRPLIRATLPRLEGQPPPTRPAPEFTIRQPAGRQGRFRPRHGRAGAQAFHGSNGNVVGPPRGGMPRQGGGHPPSSARPGRRQHSGRNRSK